jgi:transketolase
MPDFAKLASACTLARGLAMDAVHTSSSGHLGLPLGATEVGAILYGELLRHDPADPHWINRDRFILSAGHGSMFLYAWLHLTGYPLSIEELKRFRALGSKTPGHPEFGMTEGVEATTGPLGQGVGNAVGHAVAAKMLAAKFNTQEHTLFDHTVWALAGDGCMQEGVASEAAAMAAHFDLDNLILMYDSNDVTLDAMAVKSQSEDTRKRFEAYGFETFRIDKGNDLVAVHETLAAAKASKSGKPKFVVVRTLIGMGIPEVAGTQKAHGEAGAKFVDEDRKKLGLPDEHFFVSDEVRQFFAARRVALAADHAAWKKTYDAWRAKNPELAKELDDANARKVPADLSTRVPEFAPDTKVATRKASETVLQVIAKEIPSLIGASADLYGSTFNYIAASTDWDPEHRAGRNIRIGIREHGMGAIMNGMAYHGGIRPSGATFLVFADYLRPSIRLAALSHLPVTYVFTHDSVGVGEDGPTHQPVETVMGLRVIPNLDVIRPADPEETAGAWVSAMERIEGPTLLALTSDRTFRCSRRCNVEARGGAPRRLRAREGDRRARPRSSSEPAAKCSTASPPRRSSAKGRASSRLPVLDSLSTAGRGVPRGGAAEGDPPPRLDRGGRDARVGALGRDRRTARWASIASAMSAPGPIVMEKLGMNAKSVIDAAKSIPTS